MEICEVFDWIGWIGTGCILLGYYLNAQKYNSSWVVWFLGNLFMLVYSIKIDASPQVLLALVLMILNVYGYINWRKLNR